MQRSDALREKWDEVATAGDDRHSVKNNQKRNTGRLGVQRGISEHPKGDLKAAGLLLPRYLRDCRNRGRHGRRDHDRHESESRRRLNYREKIRHIPRNVQRNYLLRSLRSLADRSDKSAGNERCVICSLAETDHIVIGCNLHHANRETHSFILFVRR